MRRTSPSFIRKVMELENKIFPKDIKKWAGSGEFTQEFYDRVMGGNSNHLRSYLLSTPSFIFKSHLITNSVVTDLLKHKKKKLLSVGSGMAHLERLLVEGLGIDKSQIYLSDISSVMPEGYNSRVFDANGQWPDFGTKFDYIIFPESALLLCGPHDEDWEHKSTVGLIKMANETFPNHLNLKGEVRMTFFDPSNYCGHLPQEMIDCISKFDIEYDQKLNRGLLVFKYKRETK